MINFFKTVFLVTDTLHSKFEIYNQAPKSGVHIFFKCALR